MKRNHTSVEGISETMLQFFKHLSRKYRLSEHHRRLLLCGCEAHTRMEQAQAVIATEGLTVTDRHGQSRAHPAVAIEAQSRIAFCRVLRELALEDEMPAAVRPPRLPARRYGRSS
jgi:phage terminase small subunit